MLYEKREKSLMSWKEKKFKSLPSVQTMTLGKKLFAESQNQDTRQRDLCRMLLGDTRQRCNGGGWVDNNVIPLPSVSSLLSVL
jgi:hypothetical protein